MAFYRGLLADRVGDYRSALEELRKAADLADRFAMETERWQAEQVLARLLQDLGRSKEASELFARLRADPHPGTLCDVGSLLTNAAWSRLIAREGGEEAEDPTPMLEEAQATFDENACRPDQRLNARLNLALAHQQAGRWSEARRSLEQARPLESDADLRQRLWWNDLEARAAIAKGRPERALVLYDEMEERAGLALSPEGRFRAFLGQARARIALGQSEEALAALAEANRSIDEQSWQIPIHEGRDTFVAQREEATRLYLELLLAKGRREEAFALARRARSRLLQQLALRDRLARLTPEEQRKWDAALSAYRTLRAEIDQQAAQEWQLPQAQRKRARESRASQLARAQENLDRAVAGLEARGETRLSPPGPGEVILAYHPLPRGWVGFAADSTGIEARIMELPAPLPTDPKALSEKLLAPFRPVIERAWRVRVLSYGSLRPVDFHALPFAGELLLARRIVVYSLDLPVLSSPAPRGRSRALLVSDPQGNLPAAREEAETIAGASRAWGPAWALERLDGTEAGAERVRQALPDATLFHYAGHGTFAGFAGWNSELELADGSRLTVGDILALRPAPAWVVLSACEGGRSSEEAPGEGIGLAQAFLLAGARAVIAADQRVPDRTARDLMRELYRGWQPGEDLPGQFQRAQLASRRQDPAGRWASFRLLVP
jgi:cellulose synthase operon protein C